RSSWYWPQAHNDVVQKLLRQARKGVRIVYVPGNHDEFLRDYYGVHFGGVEVVEHAVHTGGDEIGRASCRERGEVVVAARCDAEDGIRDATVTGVQTCALPIFRSSWYWPQAHNDVVQKLLRQARKGVRIVYVPGNHDEFLRDYYGVHFGGVEVVEHAVHTGGDEIGRAHV